LAKPPQFKSHHTALSACASRVEFKMAIDDVAADDWCDLSSTKAQPFRADFVPASAPAASGIYGFDGQAS